MLAVELPIFTTSFVEEFLLKPRLCEMRRRRAQRDGYRMRWTGQMFWLLACLVPAFTPRVFGDWPNGKSYPVTAAQLLPILTGFLAPIHFSKLAKNWDED